MSNLVSLDILYKIANQKKINKYIKEIGYSKRKNKKYYVVTIDNKKIHFGSSQNEDFLIHNDKEKQKRFKIRFKKLYELNKNNINSPMFWSWNLLW